MADDRVFVITGASSGIGAATARPRPPTATASCWRRAREDKLDALVDEIGGERAIAVEADVTEWEDNEAWSGRARPLRPHRRRLRQRRLRRRARLAQGDARALARDGADERPRRGLHAARGDPGGEGDQGPPAGHGQRRGAPRAARQPLLVHQVGGDAMGEAARQDLNDTGVRVDGDRARDGRHAVLRQRRRAGRAAARGHRTCCACTPCPSPPHVDVNEILIRPTAQPT